MKKHLSMLLCCVFLLSLAACGGSSISLTEEELWLAELSTYYGTVAVTSEKTALNYLTGEYTMAQDRVGKRPYCVSVNNISDSWPQMGTSAADMIIEMETEGGITRLMCLYTDTREISLIGSVRSLREPFIQAVYPLDPIVVHIGTSIFAEKAISEHGLHTIDGDNVPTAIYQVPERVGRYASWHTYFTSGQLINEAITKLNMNSDSNMRDKTYLNFAATDEVVTLSGGEANHVTFKFSPNNYDGDFRYDQVSGTYLKFQRNQAQLDTGIEANNTQLAFKNVLVMFAKITDIPGTDPILVDLDYQDGGTGYYFSNGRYEEFTWTKPDYGTNFSFTKADGTELVLNTGKTMMCFVRNDYMKDFAIS